MSAPSPGWCVFDGEPVMIDGPFATIEQAETAAASHRHSADPEENYPTMVAWSDDEGISWDTEQPWRDNWDDIAVAS